jgi:hypothetical protein
MDTLKDIKPLVVIADNSFIYLLVLLFVVLLIVLLAGYFGHTGVTTECISGGFAVVKIKIFKYF